MADKTVAFRPFPGQSFSITGSESDAGIVGEIERSGGLYQRDLAALVRGRLAPDAVVADIGAHIGVVTVLLAGLCPKGHVYAFEPAAENHAHLAANVAANDLGNVSVERVAVFDTDGEIGLEYDAVYPGGSHVADRGAPSPGCMVPTVRFDTWARGVGLDRLDLVKIDVEGVELAVLAGAAESLRRFRPIVVVECNPVALVRFGAARYAALLGAMRALFPLVGVISPGGRITPIASPGHLRLILGRHGVIDLVGLPVAPLPEVARERLRALGSLAKLVAASNRWRAPVENFVIDPAGIRLGSAVAEVSGAGGDVVPVAVEVRNGSRFWLSSGFPGQPVNVSYRWLDAAGGPVGLEGRRSHFPEPLAPGRTARVDAVVELPARPGRYTLVLTLVQEHFAWLDDLDAGCAVRLPATVA